MWGDDMKKLQYWLFSLIALMNLLQGCSQKNVGDDTVHLIPLIEDIQLIRVLDSDANIIFEHQEVRVVQELVAGMKKAKTSYVGDPEQSGKLYELVVEGNGKTQTFSINDLRKTNGSLSAKLYAELSRHEQTVAWSLSTEWIQLLLDSELNKNEPELEVTIDENADSVIVIANRDLDRTSLKNAVESQLSISPDYDQSEVVYQLNWTDLRRVVIHFTRLPKGSTARFSLDGTKSTDGKLLHITSSQGDRGIAVQEGLSWSGLRWINTSGQVIREHSFDSATFIQPVNDLEEYQQIMIYNNDNSAYLLDVNSGDISYITLHDLEEREKEYQDKAVMQDNKEALSKLDKIELPENAVAILKSELEEWGDTKDMRVLPMPSEKFIRYYAVFIADIGSFLIDLEDSTVIPLGSGFVVSWTLAGEVVFWHSTEWKSVDFIGID